jgi:hypothetical protein
MSGRVAVKCLNCGQTIESRRLHEMVTCSCGDISVDGGRDYFKLSTMDGARWEEVALEPTPPERT